MELTEKKKRVVTDAAENSGAQGASDGSAAANESQAAVVPTKASDAYKARLDALSAPQTYTPKYEAQINDTIDKILNREEFSYDINGDALYEQYRDKYIESGKLAMEDTMARAAAMTGGYGNSWAQTAGQAAYSQELSKLNDVIPELYQMALDKYNAEGDALRNNYALLTDADNAAYSRYRDSKNDYLTERDYLQSLYDNERSWEYQLGRDAVEDGRYADETAYNREQDAKSWEYQLGRDKVSDARYDAEWKYQLGRDAVEDERYADETAYNREQDSYDRSVDEALMRAQYGGDFSGLAALYGIDEDTARELWYAQNTVTTAADETSLYGGYTKKEFTDQMTHFLEFDDADSAAKLVALAGTPEAQAVYDIYFGGGEDAAPSLGGVPGGALVGAQTKAEAEAQKVKAIDYDSKDTLISKSEQTGGTQNELTAREREYFAVVDYDNYERKLRRDEWEKARSAGNASDTITGYPTYDAYEAAWNSFQERNKVTGGANPLLLAPANTRK